MPSLYHESCNSGTLRYSGAMSDVQSCDVQVSLNELLGGISLRDLIYLAVKDAAKELLELRQSASIVAA